ncbi:hypothetical protein JAAARDRAFT_191312 [Jaapia argillacea MUCL 33604]|uniref:Uncharacterized protein n=1 Tax=Jaapia argillacea MUCL 33604 TaxID=933084 RepID=A0A067QF19_9AGAM|nr:hypothetical protein JAAARDRAFT_191312 [Jaapia argillacea MUCL 33604]
MAFEYDYPSVSTSMTPPPSPRRHHHHRSHHSAKYSPQRRAADLSRILDPTYASNSSSQSSSSPSSITVYIDDNGALHDPDYRPFPIHNHNHHSSSSSHKKRRTSGASSNMGGIARPLWEKGDSYDAVEDDEDALEDDEEDASYVSDSERLRHTRSPTYPYTSSSSASRPQSRSRHVSPQRRASPMLTHYSTLTPYYDVSAPPPTTILSTSPELEEDDMPLGDDEFVDDDESERKRHRCALLLMKSRTATKESKKESPAEKHDAQSSRPSRLPDGDYDDEPESQDWTPTCTQSLRRQWQSVVLSLRFSIFRTQRKMKRRFGK